MMDHWVVATVLKILDVNVHSWRTV